MYIAKKVCKFAKRTFRVGEPIPEGYVHDTAASRLISMGVIAEVSEGPLLPSASSIEENQEDDGRPSEPSEKGQDMEALMKRKRDELVHLAEQHGIEPSEGDTKKDLAEAILEAWAGDL